MRPPETQSSGLRRATTAALPWITGTWLFLQLISLRLGLLNHFFFDTLHADVQAIDYYSLPKAWLNLSAGKSLYGTFDPPAYGPHFTWYLAHPLLAITFGPPLSRLGPADSYGVFTLISLGMMALSAAVLAHETNDRLTRRLIWLLLLGAFPSFAMLYVGNVQAFSVLSLALLFTGVLRLQQRRGRAEAFLLAGLLVSLFTKPVVLVLLPLFLLVRETRRTAIRAVLAYLAVSAFCEVLPALNPEHTSLRRVLWLAVHPGFVRQTMNIYANGMLLTPDMRDNSIHWFNLVAQSGYRLQHIDVFSLPVFLDGIFRHRTPDWLYALPPLAILILSFVAARQRDAQARFSLVLLLTLAGSLSFFLTYPTVWEYQYTAVLPVAAALLLAGADSRLLPRGWWRLAVAFAACAWLPSLYFLSGAAQPTFGLMTLVRLDRVLPVTALFGLLITACLRLLVRASRQQPSAATTTADCSLPAESRA